MTARRSLWPALLAAALVAGPPSAGAADPVANERLADAIRAGDATAVATALDAGADPDHATVAPVLVLAATGGDPATVETLLDAGADPDALDPRGRPALAVAGAKGHVDVVRLLLASGADVERREGSPPGRTILQLVIDDAAEPSTAVLDALLDAGADVDAEDLRGETALASAAFMDRYDAAALLLERGADAHSTNGDGVTPRQWAERQGNARIVELLSEAGER